MRMTFRSLRVQLSLLYVVFTLVSMSCLGLFSYWYLGRALESSREQTMEGREARILAFINTWPQRDTSSTLSEKMSRLSVTFSESDPIQVHDLNGTLLYSSPGPEMYKVGWPGKPCIEPCYGLVRKDGHVLRTLNHVVSLDGRMVRLSLAGVIDEHAEILRTIRNSYLICCPLLLLASMAGGFALSHRALEPIHRITNEARTIGIQDLQHRLPVPQTDDELQLLAETWNDLLERLDTAVNRLTQFTSDISHDLRTTITVMLTTAGFAVRKRRSEEDYRAALNTIVVECQTTSRLLEGLLAAARADIVQQNIEWNPVDVSGLVHDVCEHLRTCAEVKRQSLQSRLCIEAWAMGDLSMIRRMITILLDNAIKYTPDGGSILVSVDVRDDRIELRVTDTGVGIPSDALSRVFDRFYRVDGSRSQDDGNTGLGLAIARWIAEAHAATIEVASTPGNGSTFTVSLPLKLEAPHRKAVTV